MLKSFVHYHIQASPSIQMIKTKISFDSLLSYCCHRGVFLQRIILQSHFYYVLGFSLYEASPFIYSSSLTFRLLSLHLHPKHPIFVYNKVILQFGSTSISESVNLSPHFFSYIYVIFIYAARRHAPKLAFPREELLLTTGSIWMLFMKL